MDEDKELISGLLCWLREDSNAHINPQALISGLRSQPPDPSLFSPLRREKEVLSYKTSEYILRITFHLFTYIRE